MTGARSAFAVAVAAAAAAVEISSMIDDRSPGQCARVE